MSFDLGVVTHECICGSDLWKVLVKFHDYEIAMYSTTMYCANCGSRALAPTLLDKPEEE